MRKLSLVLIAILFTCGVASAQPGFRQNPGVGDILGQGKQQSDAHRIFRMVRYTPATYSGASTLAADSIVIWDLTLDDGVSVDTTTTSADSAIAGIIVVAALTPEADSLTAVQAHGDKNWTWLQTYGLSQVNMSTTANIAAGDAICTSTTAGEATAFSSNSRNPRAQKIAGFSYDAATAGDDDVEVFLSGLD